MTLPPTTTPSCRYGNTEQAITGTDGSQDTARDLYICARGAGFVNVIDQISGAPPIPDPQIVIPGVRYIASTVRQ